MKFMCRIMQHCFGKPGSGGPIVAFERLLAHSTLSYSQIRQTEPAGGLNFAIIRHFISEIRAHRPDLIHIRGLGNEGFHAALAAWLAGVPNILVSVHGTKRDLKQPGNYLRIWIITYILESLTLLIATHIATVCEFAANRRFLAPYRHKFVGTVPNGVMIPNIASISDIDLRARWGISENWTLGICVSRLTEEKGYSVLAQALAYLDGNIHNFAVLVVGGGDKDGRIESRFSSLSNIKVRFTGHQKDVGSFLAASDFFLFPSLHENLSNALIEAMSYGLPAIASAVGGNSEVLAKGGGILIPVGNAEALANAISHFLADPEAVKRMGKEARQNIQNHYSVKGMVAGWESVYTRILESRHGKA